MHSSSRFMGCLGFVVTLSLVQSHFPRVFSQDQDTHPTLVLEEIARYQEVSSAYTADPDSFLGGIRTIALDHERVLVWDNRNVNIKIFSIALDHIGTLGRYGQGPGELSRSVRQLLGYRGGVIAVDIGNGRLTAYSENGSFAYSFPIRLGNSRHPVAIDEYTDRAFLVSLSGQSHSEVESDGLIQIVGLSPNEAHVVETLPGKSAFEVHPGDVSWTDVLMLSSDSLLLVKNYVSDASSIQVFEYSISARQLSPPISLLPKRMQDDFEAEYERLKKLARSRGLSGVVLRPIAFILHFSDNYLIFGVPQYGEDSDSLTGIGVDMQSRSVVDLGQIDLPEGASVFSGYRDLLIVGGATVDGPYLRGYRVILQ